MNTIKFVIVLCVAIQFSYGQSSIAVGTGSSLEIEYGANISAGSKTGNVFGEGTWNWAYMRLSQLVALEPGWNMISSYVAPNTASADSVFSSLSPALVIAKNGAGEVYWPEFGTNTIGRWDSLEAYQVYMQSIDTLTLSGAEVYPEQTPFPLSQGWSMISFLRNTQMRTDSALNSLGSSLVIAKNSTGQVYWPEFSVNMIGNLKPGKGYQLYLSSGSTLTYPTNTNFAPKTQLNKLPVSAESYQAEIAPRHYKNVPKGTGSNATLMVEAKGLSTDDEIGIWGADRILVGSGVVSQGKVAITVWGDNSMTKDVKEGALYGESLSATVWLNGKQKEQILTFEKITDALSRDTVARPLKFRADGVWIATTIETKSDVPTEFRLEQNYPNPFNPSTTIKYALPKNVRVTLEIYTMLGQKVATLVDQEQDAGYYDVQFHPQSQATGMYFCSLIAGDYRAAIKLMYVK